MQVTADPVPLLVSGHRQVVPRSAQVTGQPHAVGGDAGLLRGTSQQPLVAGVEEPLPVPEPDREPADLGPGVLQRQLHDIRCRLTAGRMSPERVTAA